MEFLKKPILTEKASALTEKSNRFTFKVEHKANKLQIKAAVEKMYGVNVVAINTMVVNGKLKSRNTKGGLVSGRSPKYKKAVVTLKDGETIDYYSNI
ncbi:50S ribosomal protein L23 [Pedobacter quisquiliarum]|jgi:large subunit ribosomal protein L23|uniref:Large ribosomal subunit protein uL23 n=1 Tax=Pedobacter quisquiliarum TaxID=1834438 RepID=A0A916XCL1_9SPHI|nr:50S ribosomal protein L23 [Pedobacter quisquiliarum]GGC61865.1 50S ribosomal protein L23 [Pedobacter quisquiliarum]